MVAQMQRRLEKLQRDHPHDFQQINRLKSRIQEFEKLSVEYQLAEDLHSLLCGDVHPLACGYYQESWLVEEVHRPVRTHYLKVAFQLMALIDGDPTLLRQVIGVLLDAKLELRPSLVPQYRPNGR